METIGRGVRASMDFSGPLNALSTSPNNKFIAVGGRDVLKVVALEAAGFAERRNLRVGKSNLSFSTNDIRWHPQLESLVATAATNGNVVIWNLQREGFKHVQERVLTGHRRAVNRICWHATDANMLFSGSQDGTIKLWDKRGKIASTYQPKSESVRDVRVSPFQSHRFAAAFENGIIQIWDLRKNGQPEVKFQAHKGLVLTLDWHPSKSHVLASGGRDRYVKIWDAGDATRPKQTIQTIASVGRVAWRPNCPDHIATCASLTDNSIHVWDIQRPCIPIASMKGHTDIASGIEWLDTPAVPSFGQPDNTAEWEGHDFWQHMLACSKDGTLKLHSLADSFKPHQSLPTTALALNSRGHVAFSHDFVDRTCASLKIHRHFNLASALFTVTDVSTSSSAGQKFTNSPFGSYGTDLDDGHESSGSVPQQRQPSRLISGGGNSHQPPLAPRSAGHNHFGYNGTNHSSGSHTTGGGILRHGSAGSSSYSNLLALQGSGTPSSGPFGAASQLDGLASVDGRRLSNAHQVPHSSATSSAPSSTTSSPVPGFLGGQSSPAPRALVALVSLQNTTKSNQLKRIFCGDEGEFFRTQSLLDEMQQAFEHGRLLKDAFGFDEDVFRFLAAHYVFFDEDMSFADMCAHNALAAFATGNQQLSQMWRILQVLFEKDQPMDSRTSEKIRSAENSRSGPLDIRHLVANTSGDGDDSQYNYSGALVQTHQRHHPAGLDDSQYSIPGLSASKRELEFDDLSSTTSSMLVNGVGGISGGFGGVAGSTSHTMMLLQQLDHVNPQAMQGFDPYPYDSHGRQGGNASEKEHTHLRQSGIQSQSKTSSVLVHGSAVHGDLGPLRESVLKELLEYYIDHGDIQTCVAIVFVVSNVTNVENIMGKSWLQQTYMHYVDLLHQLRIYHSANELILHCPDQSIRQMNMRSTTMHINCAKCSKPIDTLVGSDGDGLSSYLCAHCSNPTTRCSVCQLPVRGLYVWCPVCSHGGHLEHLSQWFSQEEVCPTGCSHKCSLNVVDLRPRPTQVA